MPVTDPISDYLTRIRNAQAADHRWVDIPASNMKKRLSLILKHERYIKDFILINDNKQRIIRVYLRYTKDGLPIIEGLKRISRPGRRQYVNADEIPRVLGGLGVAIMSTPIGVITGKIARKNNVGGEVLCHIW
ncbi:MAG: 30S ribosomal protein S8 [Candidatus Marinimicrobia bacterium]|nr:30S ribosomal protein S8 [Candidatus Neomarinimicrobiota bacterium]MBL7068073.1 30S ribosomal protein S8 [Candidatus Neomarinimicrobiota bacterium]